jgi:hypothetical protein
VKFLNGDMAPLILSLLGLSFGRSAESRESWRPAAAGLSAVGLLSRGLLGGFIELSKQKRGPLGRQGMGGGRDEGSTASRLRRELLAHLIPDDQRARG